VIVQRTQERFYYRYTGSMRSDGTSVKMEGTSLTLDDVLSVLGHIRCTYHPWSSETVPLTQASINVNETISRIYQYREAIGRR
jgi:hypothetical protein